MIKTHIDTTNERFGSAVTIAHLATFSFTDEDSDKLHIYRAEQIFRRDWPHEIEAVEMEYASGVSATFKDGSRLSVSAWADCCRPGERDFGDCVWCGGRYA